MKLKSLVIPAMLAVAFQANAAGKFGADSANCILNLSQMGTYTKQAFKTGNYKDAVAPWHAVYKDCPKSHITVYAYGPYILGWEINNTTDAAKKKALFNQMMEVYDNRIKYADDIEDSKPDFYVLGRKAMDCETYGPKVGITDPTMAYNIYAKALESGEEGNEIQVFTNYYLASKKIYESNKAAKRQQFVNDYLKVTDLLAKRAADGEAQDSIYDQMKGSIDADFGVSGACDEKILNSLYASQIEAHKSDKDFLEMVTKLYTMADAKESAVYFKASEYLYKIEPSYTAACGLANQAYHNHDVNGAISYLDKATTLAKSNADKSNIQMKVAALYSKQGNSSKSREAARKALSYNSNNGSAYLLIGQLYASGARSVDSDPLKQKAAYWAAVDKCEKAKAVDPTCASRANSLIATYKNYFPTATEGFMSLKLKQGASYHVGGWIGETTTVRYKK